MQKIVFSGGPCVGKTSILHELKARGYDVRSEVFTNIFSEVQKNNKFNELFKNKKLLINNLIHLQELEEHISPANKHKFIFLDRGMVDVFGFSKEIEYILSEEELFKIQESYYDLCFILDPLDEKFYDQNAVRRQTFQESLECHQRNIENYVLYYQNRNLDPKNHIIFVPNYLNKAEDLLSNRDDIIKYCITKRVIFILEMLVN